MEDAAVATWNPDWSGDDPADEKMADMADLSRQDELITEAVETTVPRLRSFIRKRVVDSGDAEDVLQDVLYELIAAYRLMKPIGQVSAWLYQVARNRITDLFRKKKPESLSAAAGGFEVDDGLSLEDLLPSPDAGPEAEYARTLLLDALDDALEELPPEQSEVFIAHELMGTSFKELSDETGVSVNTLLSRKRYAVLHLRRRLQTIHDDYLRR